VIRTEFPFPPVVVRPAPPAFAITIAIVSTMAATIASTAYRQDPETCRSWWRIAWALISSSFREVLSVDEVTVPSGAFRFRAGEHVAALIFHTSLV
jgi:hypothetical protein